MTTQSAIYSVSICARATLNMHSLNNEGGEGNQIQTRMVNIVGADGQLHNVNAISGDMFKHIQAEHLHRLALEADLPLSAGARQFNANRVNFDIDAQNDLLSALNGVDGDGQELDVILQRCAVTDLEGILVTAGKRSLPRKSVVEFGWVVGVPELVETDSYFHVKYAADRSAGAREQAESEAAREANVGQSIFHRPASSGIYAIVLNLETARIGFNDLTQSYAIDEPQRKRRLKALLESVLYTLIEPAGAMRSTQNPHIVDLVGAVTLSRSVAPAPCISPLKPRFVEDIQRVANAVNQLRTGAIEVKSFSSMGDFAQIMADLIESATPFVLPVAQANSR
ncbi:MAG: DevR family CRISPR-associated autoregulator [Chloroflexi bacterium]|nr:MAG: DevR family CRISPR-associated autoregulator [Chloroflexota bacterium]